MTRWLLDVVAHSFRILVVRSWVLDLAPIEASLRAAGIDAALTNVDFRAALIAALGHDQFDAAIFDPRTTELSYADVEACLRGSGYRTPLIVLDDVTAIGSAVLTALAPRRN